MDFFKDQERARTNSKLLVVLFIVAVCMIIASIYLLFLVAFAYESGNYWHPKLLFWVSAGTLLLVSSGSLYKISQLTTGGGSAVAEAMGARLVQRETTDLLEQRLLNVVDEMAIASGISVPKVYVMDDETAINAFAAGSRPSEAVVAVTRGCLEQLSRDELQGVIGHEFSHIFNGDMRLNLRLMGILHGILIIALIGRVMMRVRTVRSRNNDARAQIALISFGLALFIIGYIGIFFGNLIKSAVSRQREFLADAAAVQFTRNPHGIAGALKKIAGIDATLLKTPNAEQASHMFFGQAVAGFMATHPPIQERIARIDPAFRALQKSTAQTASTTSAHPAAAGFAITPEAIRDSIGVVDQAHIDYAQQLIAQLPENIETALHSPQQAAQVIYALLIVHESDPQAVLLATLGNQQPDTIKHTLAHLPWLKQCSRALWLPLVELALPAMRELSLTEREQVLKQTEALVRADGKVSLFEFALLAIMEYQLDSKKNHRSSGKQLSVRAIQADMNLLLSLLAHVGKKNRQQIEQAFAAATALAPLDGAWQLLEPKNINLKLLATILNRLNTLKYSFKAKLIQACTAAILSNGEVALVEAELLRAIGARLECPVPPLLVGQSL